MLSMLKSLTISTLLISSSLVAKSFDDKVIDFEKNRFSANKRIVLKNLTVHDKKSLTDGWYGYVVNVSADVGGKVMTVKDIVFTNGNLITPELFDIKSGVSLKTMMSPKLSDNFYNKEHLILGSENAKNKLVIFSDPLCPFCIDFVPEVIKYVKKHEDKIALYYYHFPLLRLHPAADVVSKAMLVAKKKGLKDIEEKIYNADFEKYFTEKETNKEKILKGINAVLKTNFTVKDIEDKSIAKEIEKDVMMGEEVMVQGTPTIFVNGDKDNSKTKWEVAN